MPRNNVPSNERFVSVFQSRKLLSCNVLDRLNWVLSSYECFATVDVDPNPSLVRAHWDQLHRISRVVVQSADSRESVDQGSVRCSTR